MDVGESQLPILLLELIRRQTVIRLPTTFLAAEAAAAVGLTFRLPCAGWPHDSDGLTGRDLELDVSQADVPRT